MGLKKIDVIAELKKRGAVFNQDTISWNELRALYKATTPPCPRATPPEEPAAPTGFRLESKIRKRNTFLGDAVRDERDKEVLHAEIGKRQYKGKIKTVTTIKHMDVTEDGFWLTEFVVDLKE